MKFPKWSTFFTSHPKPHTFQDPSHHYGLTLLEKLKTPTDKASLSSYQIPWIGYPDKERQASRQLYPFQHTLIFTPFLFILPLYFFLKILFSVYSFNLPISDYDLSWFFNNRCPRFIKLSSDEFLSFRILCLQPFGSLHPTFPLTLSAFPIVFYLTFIFSFGLSLPWYCLEIVPNEPPTSASSPNSQPSVSSPTEHTASTSNIIGMDLIARTEIADFRQTLHTVVDLLQKLVEKQNYK